ncbi:MAG TPA: nuclear transport factor 2 family protein, partial [Chloroflexota bacterium]
ERHDIESMLAEMAEDTVFENTSPAPDGTRLVGIAAMRKFFTELFEANPNTRFDIEEQFAAGDRCVVRWRYDRGMDTSAAWTSFASATVGSPRPIVT